MLALQKHFVIILYHCKTKRTRVSILDPCPLKNTSLRTEQPQPSGTSLLLRFTSGRLKYHSWVASPWTSSVLISGSKYDPGPWTFQGTWRDLQAGITSIACSIIKYMSCQVGSFPFRKLSIQYTHWWSLWKAQSSRNAASKDMHECIKKA